MSIAIKPQYFLQIVGVFFFYQYFQRQNSLFVYIAMYNFIFKMLLLG